MALRDLLARFDIDTGGATTKLREFDKGLKAVKGALGQLAGQAIAAFGVAKVASFIHEQIEMGDALVDTATKLGVATDELQAFQYGAGIMGVASDQAAAAIGFLNKNVGEALDGNKAAAEAFQKLGVALKDSQGVREIGDLLPEIADGFAQMGSQQERTAAAMSIFGKQGAALLPFLQQGSEGVEQLRKEFDELGGGLSDDFLSAADNAGDAIFRFDFAMKGLKSRLAVAVMPTIAEWATKLGKAVATLNKVTRETNLVKYAWIAMGGAGVAASAKAAVGFAKFLGLLPRGAGLMKSLFSLGQIGLVIAAVAALALIFEDIWVGIQGGQSLIKDWLKETLGVDETNKLFGDLKLTFDKLGNSFKEMGPVFKDIGKDLLKLGAEAGPAIAKAFVFILKVIGSAIALLGGFGESIAEVVKAVAQLASGSNEGIDGLGGKLGKIVGRAGNRVFGQGGFFGAPSAVPEVGPTIGPPRPPTSASVEQKNDITINVNGGATNAETGRAVAGAVRGALPTSDLNAALAGLAVGTQ